MRKLIPFILFTIILNSCSNEVIDPIDEKTEKGHDNWTKVIFTFTEGEVSNTNNIHFKGYKKDDNLDYKTVQEYKFELIDEQVKASGNTIKLAKGGNYSLEIHYYSDNELINYQFVTKEMAPIHQHFFITDPKKGTVKQTEKNTIDYFYRDTNPTDKMLGESGVELRGVNDPIGLKGYFNVFKEPNHSFDLNVILVHVIAGTKLDESNKPYPFYAPSVRVIGTRDLSVKIPMKIFTDVTSENYVQDVANEFNISQEKAKNDIDKRIVGNLKL